MPATCGIVACGLSGALYTHAVVERIALISDGFEDYTAMLANSIASTLGLSVTIIGPDSLSDRYQPRLNGHVEFVGFPSYRIRSPRNWALGGWLRACLESRDVELVHLQVGGDPWIPIAVRRACGQRPIISTVHEAREERRDEDHWWSVLGRNATVGCSNEIVALSQSVARVLSRRYGAGLPPTTVMPLGEIGTYYRSGSARAPTGQPKTDRTNSERINSSGTPVPPPPWFLFFGRIRPYKGLGSLVDASALLAAEVPDFRLIVAGTGATGAELFPNGFPSWLDLRLRHIDDDEVAELFDSVRAVVLPYRRASQSGVAALSLGLGCPVIASDVGGLPEAVRHGLDGIVYDAQQPSSLLQALRGVATQDLQALHLREGAAETATRSGESWRAIASATGAIYDRVAHT